MKFAGQYLLKQNNHFLFNAPEEMVDCKLVVVIPCCNEPDLEVTLKSLFKCVQPESHVALLVVVNDSDKTETEILKQNRTTVDEIETLKAVAPEWLHLFSIYASQLPAKYAGAGWARKIGMDWAITHFDQTGNSNGIIISLDADTTVEPNYFQAIEYYFNENPDTAATTIYFEHPTDQGETDEAITWYELYMRYYKHAVAFTGFPHSIYTVGSCFAVRARAYVAQGGMNRKKAGEDFYFLHKLTPLGKVGTLNTTTVYPSARLSNRVPFGTGPSLQKFIDGDNDLTLSYPLISFEIIRAVFVNVEEYYQNRNSLSAFSLSENNTFREFCNQNNVLPRLVELIHNCSHVEVFRKRFFHFFNAFFILKWLNFALLNGCPKVQLLPQAQLLLRSKGMELKNTPNDPKLMLKLFRSLDKAERNA